jgi:CubicO group peptidase (beta-lactamase class C family)
MRTFRTHGLLLCLVLIVGFSPARAQTPQPSPDLPGTADRIAREVLTRTGVPSASVAIVRDGQLAYLQAYGDARLEPRTPARPDMRYSVGSISKQFTAAAILLLAEQGKLSLNDPVARFLPNLTRAHEVTIRQLLSHTSGYQDYWPQDYVMPPMLQPVTTEQILDQWARKPLDFDPGTKWQYSNTNYVIAGLVVEKAGGLPFMQFLKEKILTPLGIENIVDVDQQRLGPADPTGYMRYALGPLHPAPKEGKGWLFAAGGLAMSAADLAKWDISMIQQRLLKPASYKEMETEVMLKSGAGTHYGLGVDVDTLAGHRVIAHSGEVSGFTASNLVFPDDRVAVAVLTNQDAISAASQISRKIAESFFGPAVSREQQRARQIFEGLQHGKIDRSLLTANCSAYFSEQALRDFASSLGPLGAPEEFAQTSQGQRGGMTFRSFRVRFPQRTLVVTTYVMPDGNLEQYLVAPRD